MEQSLQSRFYPGDLMIRTGDREIRSVSGRVGMYATRFDISGPVNLTSPRLVNIQLVASISCIF